MKTPLRSPRILVRTRFAHSLQRPHKEPDEESGNDGSRESSQYDFRGTNTSEDPHKDHSTGNKQTERSSPGPLIQNDLIQIH